VLPDRIELSTSPLPMERLDERPSSLRCRPKADVLKVR
jgi:hypothetical protein